MGSQRPRLDAGRRSGLMLSATDHPESDQETHRIFSVAGLGRLAARCFSLHTDLLANCGSRLTARPSVTLAAAWMVLSPHDLMLLDIGKRATRNLTGASLDRAIHEHRWAKDGSLLALYRGWISKQVCRLLSGRHEQESRKLAGQSM